MNSTTQKQFPSLSQTQFEDLFNAQYSRLCVYAYNFLKEEDASEEIVQEVFVKLWVKREEIQIETSQESYLFRAVRNSCINLIKHIDIREEYKSYNERRIQMNESDDSDTLQVSELDQKIRDCIDLLPEQRRKIFIMSRYDGLKYKEIAEKLNISVKTVENQMGKALQTLRKDLAEYLPLAIIFFHEIFR